VLAIVKYILAVKVSALALEIQNKR